MIVPYNSPNLAFANKASTSAAASPFVVAMIDNGIKTLPGFLNGCILIFIFSAANSDVYISSRTLYALAKEGDAPRIFAHTNRRGVPVYSLSLSAVFACLAFMNVSQDSKLVFGYFVNVTTVFGLLVWISILVSHICFVRGRVAQRIDKAQMTYTAPFGVAGSYVALVLCIIITLIKSFDVFIHDKTRKGAENFDAKTFVTSYIGIPVYLALIAGCKLWKRTKRVTANAMELSSGFEMGDEVASRDKEAYSSTGDAAGGRLRRFYRRFVSWLL
jgi:amino acid transporter